MKISVKSGGVSAASADLLVIPVSSEPTKTGREAGPRLPQGVAGLDRGLGGVIAQGLASGDFQGRPDQRMLLYPASKTGQKSIGRILLLGIGDRNALTLDSVRRFAGAATGEARERKLRRLAILAPRARGLRAEACAGALAEGAVLGAYRYDRFKSQSSAARSPGVPTTTLLFDRSEGLSDLRKSAKEAVICAESQNIARDLSNAPGNELPPAGLAREARRVARETGLHCRVIRGAELERGKFSALLAVGSGSVNPPQLIVLEHRGARKGSSGGPLCLVGKGITFDSGGISIKPSAGMGDMKHDMSGAAAVVGALRAAAALNLPAHVVGIIAAAENMPSGTAYRPGDVIRSRSGKTIEVTNTDAEGRVVLADALDYAVKQYKPKAMIDLATLTGAAMIAFGPWATGAMGNDDALLEEIRQAGEETSERMCVIPLLPEHLKEMSSPIADLKNSGAREGGVSTAGAFLQEFVGGTPWAHLDIAGTGWTNRRTPYHRQGATGVGVRMLVAWVRARVQQNA
ncbi:MAG: leucyl aminopeptidase [Myxococcota bacterium]|jgi:leucyl aminopeptidase|nr:leucyl aminopeptidase [Myxococcota bacterium]